MQTDTQIQHICCDGTTPTLPVRPVFMYKSSFHVISANRLNVDFTLHVRNGDAEFCGMWRCRISFWLADKIEKLHVNDGLSYYLHGFKLCYQNAQEFINSKYGASNILIHPTDAELTERYFQLLEKKAKV